MKAKTKITRLLGIFLALAMVRVFLQDLCKNDVKSSVSDTQ